MGMEASGCHLCTLPLPHSRPPISPGRELVHSPGTLIFVTAAKKTPLDCLALAASGLLLAVPWGCTYLHTVKVAA